MKQRWAAAWLVACACAAEDPEGTPTVTYHRDIRPLIEANCVNCHVEGGIGPFALTSYEEVKAAAVAVVASVEARRMPPWPPDPACRSYVDERHLSDAQIAQFGRWLEQATPEGDASQYVAPLRVAQTSPEVTLGAPTASLGPSEAYAPNPASPDDYRCFPLPYAFGEETFVVASEVVPDQLSLVHHVILFLIPPQFADAVDERDAEEPGPGYTCFGGAGVGGQQPIGGWVPGSVPAVSGPEARIRIPKGARLVMQMHYNTLSASPLPDQTQVRLWFTEEVPPMLLDPRFMPHLGIRIPAGEADHVETREFKNNSATPWTIVASAPHMHLLGTRQRVHKIGADGQETCLVDIPRWDFGWQQTYVFLKGQEVQVLPGESIRLECSYNNSASNQPIVNGQRLEPRTVTWGEGTLDEMCLNTMWFLTPYAPLVEPGDVCQDFQGCYDTCKAGGNLPLTGCILQCGRDGCAQCVLPGTISCLSEECGPEANTFIQCLEGCGSGPSAGACIQQTCAIPIVNFDRCARPYLEAGDCDSSVSACGADL